MCTLLFYRDVLGPGTLALAANRDEDPSRPWEPPRQIPVGGRIALFPRDHRGGTWLGTNGRLAAALTNMAPPGGEGSRSRGLLVRDLLGEDSLAPALACLRRLLEEDSYDGFNLLLADPTGAAVLTWHEGRLQEADLGPGVWLLRHRVHGAAEPASAEYLPGPGDGEAPESFLRGIAERALSTHGDGPPGCEAACRHGSGFATLSATLLFLDPSRPQTSRFLSTQGQPCRNPFIEYDLPDPISAP